MKSFRVVLFLFLIALTACGGLPSQKDGFKKRNDNFILRVRWLDFQGASMHFTNELREEFAERFGDVRDLKVTNFKMERMDVDSPNEKVIVHYLIEYYKLPSVTLTKKRFSLSWEELPSGNLKLAYWRITEPFPEL